MVKQINNYFYLFPDNQEEIFTKFIDSAHEECTITIPKWLKIFNNQQELDNFIGGQNARSNY